MNYNTNSVLKHPLGKKQARSEPILVLTIQKRGYSVIKNLTDILIPPWELLELTSGKSLYPCY